jgi:antitoxin ParD1/3/4
MPTRNINLTPQMDKFVEAKIRKGEYANASEVLRAGLRALEKIEREDKVKLQVLREAITDGENSGVFKGDLAEDMNAYLNRLVPGKTVA